MKHLCIFSLLFTVFVSSYAQDDVNKSQQNSNRRSKSLHNYRNKREIDEEDVVNRFEMERSSPLYDILRHLPPFEDGWMPNPVTDSSFSLPTTKDMKNDPSSYGEFKIEVSKEAEHVVSESGRQFQENAALNWYYSEESYSSINHFNSSSTGIPTVQSFSPKITTTRKHDDNHVVSHVPSLRGERGAFVDFNLLESSTTPKVDILPAKVEEPKPNITTRYILLQSGRIVAINVTSVSSVFKPTSSSGSNKNSLLPTYYFGSRIRNKNNTKSSANNTHQQKKESTPTKPIKIDVTTETIRKPNVHTSNSDSSKNFPPTTLKPRVTTTKRLLTTIKPLTTTKIISELSTVKWLAKIYSGNSVTIKPNVEYVKLKPTTTTIASTPLLKDITTLDPAEKWWSNMKAAKKERIVLLNTTPKPLVTTASSRNIWETFVEALETPEVEGPFEAKTFESIKKQTTDPFAHTTTELTITGRNVRHRMLETNFQFSTSSTLKPFSGSDFSVNTSRNNATRSTQPHKIFKSWTTTTQAASTNKFRNISPTTSTGETLDILEPPAPLSEVRHDFVRLVRLSPPVLPSPEITSVPSTVFEKDKKDTSRRPRYRGLSHVNLQAPKQETTKTTTIPSIRDFSNQPKKQFTSVSFRRPTHQQQQITTPYKNLISSALPILSTTPSSRRSRPGFYLRNSVSFQTIPPGSLTDRRTLSTEAPILLNSTVKRLQPPLEDLLIISFEPTRKTSGMKVIEKFTDDSPIEEEKKKNYRNPSKNTSPVLDAPLKHNRTPISTTKSPRIPMEKPVIDVWSNDRTQSQFDSGNRVGRNFRPNNPRSQNFVEKIESTSPSPTTRQPFRVYFFEPKRKKTKNTEANMKNETSDNTRNSQQSVNSRSNQQVGNLRSHLDESTRNFPQSGNTRINSPVVNTRHLPPAQNTRRHSPPEIVFTNNHQTEGAVTSRTRSPTNRGTTPVTSRGRNVFFNENSYDSRQPKQLQVTSQSSSTETNTTPKSAVKRHKNSPFIWHRPNVGTARLNQEDNLHQITPQEVNGANNGTFSQGNFRQVNVHRTG